MKPYTSCTKAGVFLFLLASFTIFIPTPLTARQKIFHLTNGCDSAEIPFRLVQDLMVVTVMLGGKRELNFILDTGTSSALIFNRNYLQGLDIPYGRRVTFYGAGKGRAVRGQVINGIALHLSGAATDRIGMVVLDYSPFQKLELQGVPIHGVLGSNFFNSFVVEIDFRHEILTLHEYETFKPNSTYAVLPMQIHFEKPIIQASIHMDEAIAEVNLMVDTGFNNSLLLYAGENNPVRLPEKVRTRRTGLGYSGRVVSKVGYIQQLSLGGHTMHQVFTIFPNKKSYQWGESLEHAGRHGTLGIGTLKEFDLIFDYPGKKFYLKEQEKPEKLTVEWHKLSD